MNFGCWGAATGGCLAPIFLFFVAAALGDTGGPLFWPILAVFLGLIGLVLGLIIEGFRRWSRSKLSTLKLEDSHETKGEQNGADQPAKRSESIDIPD